MIYQDRVEAAHLLAKKLEKYKGMDGVVIAIPRGGLPVGYVLAKYLGFYLDIALTKKIGHPINKEYAIGSVSLQSRILGAEQVAPEYIEAETARLRKILQEKNQLYRGDSMPIDLQDKVVVVTDDGIATGNTMLATIELVKQQRPKQLIVAVPVAPPDTVEKIQKIVDEVVCFQTPSGFYAVGQFYENFESVPDKEAIAILKSTHRETEERF